jgi:predicted ATPase
MVYSSLRDADRTLSLTEEAIALSTKYSFEVPLAWATSFHGWALAEMGEEEGLSTLMNGLSAEQAAKASLNSTYTLALLAEIYLRKKRIDEGLDTLAKAQKLLHSTGERCWQAELLRLKGELLLGQDEGSVPAAEQSLSEALNIAQSQHARMLELRAATSLARLLRKLNKLDVAKRVLSPVHSQFRSRVTTRDLSEAQAILQQLSR